MIFRGILPASAHPALPELVAKVFGWKVVDQPSVQGLPYHFLDTGREIFSLPHFNHAAGPILPAEELREELLRFQAIAKKPVGLRLTADASIGQSKKVVSLLPFSDGQLPAVIRYGNLARKVRAAVSRGVMVERHGIEGLRSFYNLYEQRLHELGSAGLPLKFFQALMHHYADRTLLADPYLYLARHQGRIVGGAFSLRFGSWFENGWFATDLSSPSRYVAYALHDTAIRDAFAAKATVYSFGRSTPESGVHHFKQQWTSFEMPIYLLRIPSRRFEPRQFPQLHQVWKKVPLPIARLFNPYLAKWMY